MTPYRRTWLLGLIIALFLGGALATYWMSARFDGGRMDGIDEHSLSSAIQGDARGRRQLTGVAEGAVNAPPSAVLTQRLPGPDTPLLTIHADLLSRLGKGDVGAGCRLAMELRRCWHDAQSSQNVDALLDHAATRDLNEEQTQETAGLMRRLEENRRRSQKVCEGVGEEQFDEYFDVVRRTAGLGDPLAMVEFADNGGFLLMEFTRRPDRLATWHRLAPEMIERALRLGTPEAAFSLHMARSHEVGMLAALLPDDPVEAHAMSLLLNKTLSKTRELRPPRLSPQQILRAEERANVLYVNYFARRGKQPPLRFARDPLRPPIEECELAR